MITMKLYLKDSFNPVRYTIKAYRFRKNFLCMKTMNNKYICYNLNNIDMFEVEMGGEKNG